MRSGSTGRRALLPRRSQRSQRTSLGIIDADKNAFIAKVPTAFNAHSLAADQRTTMSSCRSLLQGRERPIRTLRELPRRLVRRTRMHRRCTGARQTRTKTTTTDQSSSSSNATRASTRGELGVRRTRPSACDLATLAELCQRAAGQSAPEAGKDGRRHDSLAALYTLKRPEPGTDARAPAGTMGLLGLRFPLKWCPGAESNTDTGFSVLGSIRVARPSRRALTPR